jgi:putative thioredoxin
LIRTDGLDAAQVRQFALANPDDVAAQIQCADVEVLQGDLEQGFKRLLNLITILSGDEQKSVKERLLELFALVDPADPRVIKARTALANALF